MPATYEPIATTTLSSAAANIEFTSIPSTYTDLRIVLVARSAYPEIRMNGITTTTYSQTDLYGDGSSALSNRYSNQTRFIGLAAGTVSGTTPMLYTFDIFSYAGSTNKTVLFDSIADINGTGGTVEKHVGLWRNTAAVTSINLIGAGANFTAGTTATLYGIKAA